MSDDDPGRRLEEVGTDPDPRFTLANERTFLAWVRTGLALSAAGLAAVEFLSSQREAVRLAIGLPLILLGALTAFASHGRWEANERAMRLGRPLPLSRLPRVLALGVGLVAVAAIVLAVAKP